MNYLKKIVGIALLSTMATTSVFAEWPTTWSGNLPRPVLFVHGINANHSSWSVDVAQKICIKPTVKLLFAFSYVNPLTPSRPMGHNFKFSVTCEDGSSRIVYKKYNSTSSGNRLNGELPKDFYGWTNPTPPYGLFISITDVEWGISGTSLSNSNVIFRRVLSKGLTTPTTYDIHFNESVKSSDIAKDIVATWTNRPYSDYPNSYSTGLVSAYKEEALSPPALLARYYKMPPDALKFNYPLNPANSMINHNGLEFYSSTNPVDQKADEFARPDKTNGPIWNSRLNRNEVGQTDQLYDRMSAVLTEYFDDWKFNKARQIDLVCHSQGCVVVRNLFVSYTSSDPANPINHIKSIVMLTSPQLGTAIATDNSGVPAVSDLRKNVYSLKDRGCLNPIPITVDFSSFLGWLTFGLVDVDVSSYVFTVDPLKGLRETANNFTNTDQYLSYSSGIQTASWLPSTSVMKSGYNATTGYSSFITAINNFGYPTRPIDGVKIPITAYYGTVPGIGKKLIEAGIQKGLAACQSEIIPTGQSMPSYGGSKDIKLSADDVSSFFKESVSSFLQNYPCTEITQLLADKTCSQLVTAAYNKFLPTVTQLDVDWTPFSDLAVDLGSQKLEGSFPASGNPFEIKPLIKKNPGDLGTPHMTVAGAGEGDRDLLGATAHGLEILSALEKYNGKTQVQVDATLGATQSQPPVSPPPPPKPYVYIPGGISPFGNRIAPFYMWKTEQTYGDNTPKRMNVSASLAHCNLKSIEQGLNPVYDLSNPVYSGNALLWYKNIDEHLDRNGWRLPSKDEWTHAYLGRMPPSEQYYWGNNTSPAVAKQYAVYGGEKILEVGSKLPNSWGIFDMAGSFGEWVGPVGITHGCWEFYGGSDKSNINAIKYSSYECSDGVHTNILGSRLNIGLRMVRNAPINLSPIYGLLLN